MVYKTVSMKGIMKSKDKSCAFCYICVSDGSGLEQWYTNPFLTTAGEHQDHRSCSDADQQPLMKIQHCSGTAYKCSYKEFFPPLTEYFSPFQICHLIHNSCNSHNIHYNKNVNYSLNRGVNIQGTVTM